VGGDNWQSGDGRAVGVQSRSTTKNRLRTVQCNEDGSEISASFTRGRNKAEGRGGLIVLKNYVSERLAEIPSSMATSATHGSTFRWERLHLHKVGEWVEGLPGTAA
jgi:hypothetical protein